MKFCTSFLFALVYYSSISSLNILGCRLWGSETGECSLLPLDDLWRAENMPFCYDKVLYRACLPKQQTLPPSREFPNGRWFNHTVRAKDDWVRYSCELNTEIRRAAETNKTLKNLGVNEYGDKGTIIKRFWHNDDCQNAYKSYFCWVNFPRCDDGMEYTLPTCRSACQNFFRSCMYSSDLWRCYESKYFNGWGPEQPTGNRTYLRDFFPGQPFRENRFDKNGDTMPLCTPALKGNGNQLQLNILLLFLCIFFIFACIIYQ
mmetsp:Transcript_27846/g.28096  ORF Transcript_27846/g.28096 Transcript_27846/m.28096 type:complete len:260 (-) Transcript_27846:97-876(-)